MNAIRKFMVYKQSNGKENRIYLSGELDLSAASSLANVLDSVVRKAEETLILDLKELKYIDSTGIGLIVSAIKVRAAMQAVFQIDHIPAKVRRLFDITGVSNYLHNNGSLRENQGVTERKEEII
ncbi:STAS domain-containing protein [Paenibacillus sp. Soil766]|uniref:STAS domain-containing protein n=1 Tax=Paenibacillus sp. Soil766 TaxID=1736404 RepID=UPI000AD7E401|nr:STAS domain-containing protein [Paenibacillus sp. Soil766]